MAWIRMVRQHISCYTLPKHVSNWPPLFVQLRTQSGASMIFVNAIWVALLVTNLYRNYNIAQHWNTEPVVLAWGTTLTLLKVRCDQFKCEPTFV
jgi:hypothetical protein